MNHVSKLLNFKKIKTKAEFSPFYIITFLNSKSQVFHLTKSIIQKYNFLKSHQHIKFPIYFQQFLTLHDIQNFFLTYNKFSYLVYIKFKYIFLHQNLSFIKLLQSDYIFLNINIILNKYFYIF
jgi:hypothetical protein